uniref:Carboxylic ester hydrolase n=1 Tax=Trichogramma kaykai TaxID=54128 RepID=A0ABD2X6V0_9HYME
MANPHVNVNGGRLKGFTIRDFEGKNYYAFRGIPFAKPPLGELRFKDPVPAEKWIGTRDALNFGPMAVHFDIFKKAIVGSDDCLYINVYTNSIDDSKLQPVLVWIHGGGFIFGSGEDDFYGADYFMRKDVVLVTFNYRLGVLGFLNLEDEIAPGNQGLKDQVMALEWVRDNISNFGGDPENVTIFGESAGGASVHYLTLSPLARGLFHKAISQSGVVLNPWAAVPENPKNYAYKLCKMLGKETKNSKEIVEFLRTIPYTELMIAQQKMAEAHLDDNLLSPFGPGIDAKSSKPFLPIEREIAAKQGAHVPYMIGHNDREGTMLLKMFGAHAYENINKKFEKTLHPFTRRTFEHLYNLTSLELKQIYFHGEEVSKGKEANFIKFVSDMNFIHGIHQVIKAQVESNSSSTYMYVFTYDEEYSYVRSLCNTDEPGASHMDELRYLFTARPTDIFKIKAIEKSTVSYKMMETMIELWTNFAKTGYENNSNVKKKSALYNQECTFFRKPTKMPNDLISLHWLPVTNGKVLRYLNIGKNLRMEKMLNIEEKFN